jgi:Tfp pilus assembly protein PilF
MRPPALLAYLAIAMALAALPLGAQTAPATVREYDQVFPTYPFGDPNPIPVVGRIYPYFRFDGFASRSQPRAWHVVELENAWIRVTILPEIGGKIWNAVEKRTGRSFIYFNQAVKFRDIALRGPWTSGGIEANYGIIGHTPNVATPVDYVTRTNADGSVSCIIGALDLLTRTPWRLEIRLAPDEAAFSTTSFWYNASTLEQPYYTWMNAGIKVRGNLQLIYPGTSRLGHDGEHAPWPIDTAGRDLSWYEHNDFGGYKSYHVFGQDTDFFGAYWHDDDFGMVRYAPRDEKAGKKIWIWGLSRQGMIWEQLLTDTDGQYAEIQSGRLFNQSADGSTFTPFKHRGFAPHTADRWTEYWYPVVGTGGFVAASRIGALNVTALGDRVILTLSPVMELADTLAVTVGSRRIYARFVARAPLTLFVDTVAVDPAQRDSLRITVGGDRLEYRADGRPASLARPLDAPAAFDWQSAYGRYLRGKELLRQREYAAAEAYLDSALALAPYFVPALADRAMLAVRALDYEAARRYALTALSVDTYDGAANYYYGLANRRLGRFADAKDGFDIAALAPEFRGAAWTELGRMALERSQLSAAARYARQALDVESGNLDALGVAIVAARLTDNRTTRDRLLAALEALDPLSHQARLERLLARGDTTLPARHMGIRAELPEQVLLELASWYADAGDSATARRVLEAAGDQPEALYWRAWLSGGAGRAALLARANAASPRQVFPFRPEIVPALRWAVEQTPDWKPRYYLALAYWACGRAPDARALLTGVGDQPDYPPFYAARAALPGRAAADVRRDLERAAALDPAEWRYGRLLVEHLLAAGSPDPAAALARRYAERFPANDVLGLTLARALVSAGEYREADTLLALLEVLPSEGARDAHVYYRQTKLMLAVEAIGAARWEDAARLIAEARLWPERLGAGRPYDADTDERLEDWLLADVLDRRARSEDARAIWTRLAEDRRTTGSAADVLPLWALVRLGRSSEAALRLGPWPAARIAEGLDGAVLTAWLGTRQAGTDRLALADSLRYGVGSWEPDSLGNHRAVVRVAAASPAVYAHIPWRRRDRHPENVNLVVVAAATQQRVRNVARVAINREYGDIVFQADAPGEYYVYYLPYTGSFRSNYPRITYRVPVSAADTAWLARHRLGEDGVRAGAYRALPAATLVGFDAVNEFSRFTPMEYIAGAAEREALGARDPDAPFLAFPEDRALSIRMTDDIPHLWAERGAFQPFSGTARRGEYYTFQVGVWAHRAALDSLRYQVTALTRRGGTQRIPASAVTSFNLEGVDWAGGGFVRALHVDSGKVQPLWFGVDVPVGAAPGAYEGRLTLGARGGAAREIRLVLNVGGDLAVHHGDDAPAQLTRLRWLNSQLAADDSVVAPFTPARLAGRTVSVLGRSLTFGADGLPASIRSYFTPNNTAIGPTAREILDEPMRLIVRDTAGRPVALRGAAPVVTRRAAGVVAWETRQAAGALRLHTRATLEFDGTAEYTIALAATARTSLADVRLELPLRADAARYMMGLGQPGGYRPGEFHWTWNVATKNQDAVWLGDVNAGLQLSLKDERYVRPLNTNFYLSKPLIAPRSWANDGKGGCDITRRGEQVLLSCYSGSHMIEAGDSLRFDFRLMITPFKPLDTAGQWATRYFHAFVPVDSIQRRGANTVNVHHANRVNPWINYPFLEPAAMRSYIDSAHALGLRAKIYYTVRELTNHAPELSALRSLGDEVLSHGPGGGFSWLQEHLGEDYIAAWHVPEIKDAAVVNSGVSRWHNFYIEGLSWLVANERIDGLYLDDVAFDRITMKRVRRVLDRGNPGALIDLHSANQYNPRDGFASSANLYLEHFPFINRLWFGEYFDYDARPDYWLVEISGIPFGLMGEMLEKGGNPWRGMTMGMTARLPWSGDPGPLWRVWDEFGIRESRMQGWWSGQDPVTTGDSAVLATTWIRPGAAMVALGSWRDDDVLVRLTIDWQAIGLDPARTLVRAPAIDGFQDAGSWASDARIPVRGKQGLLLLLEQR